MEDLNNMATLFDEFIVGNIMEATGADPLTARFMLALHRGVISGDVHIEGQEFRGTPFRDSPAHVELKAPAWSWSIVTGSLEGNTATHSVSFQPGFDRFTRVRVG
jgi:hypothetical protein